MIFSCPAVYPKPARYREIVHLVRDDWLLEPTQPPMIVDDIDLQERRNHGPAQRRRDAELSEGGDPPVRADLDIVEAPTVGLENVHANMDRLTWLS